MESIERKPTIILGIAFDLEGTIVDLEMAHHNAHIKAAASVGIHLSWQEAFERIPSFVGGPDEAVADEIASLANKKVSLDEILYAKKRYFEEDLQQNVNIFPREGFLEFANWVKSLGLKLSIGTVTNTIMAKFLFQRAGLSQVFDEVNIIAREDISDPKPAPDVYIATARKMKIPPEKQLVFEDSLVGVKSALSARCRVIAMPTLRLPVFIQSLYHEGAEAVFETWSNLEIYSFVLQAISIGPSHKS
jgi:beta-phosphoglucomutase